MSIPDQWVLTIPLTDEVAPVARALLTGRPVDDGYHVPIRIRPGTSLDWTDTGFSIPIVSTRTARVLTTAAPSDVQLIPTKFNSSGYDYFAVNVLRIIDCLDEVHSKLRGYRGPGDFDYPIEPVIDQNAVKDYAIFRVKSWSPMVVVDHRIKHAFDAGGLTGNDFIPLKTM